MHNEVEIAVSWFIIGVMLIWAVLFGVFLQRTSRVNTFHAQVNPIIERSGGLSNQSDLNAVSKDMSENGHVKFYVTPVQPSNTHTVEGYGRPVEYKINIQIPFFRQFNKQYNNVTTSKVGEETKN